MSLNFFILLLAKRLKKNVVNLKYVDDPLDPKNIMRYCFGKPPPPPKKKNKKFVLFDENRTLVTGLPTFSKVLIPFSEQIVGGQLGSPLSPCNKIT